MELLQFFILDLAIVAIALTFIGVLYILRFLLIKTFIMFKGQNLLFRYRVALREFEHSSGVIYFNKRSVDKFEFLAFFHERLRDFISLREEFLGRLMKKELKDLEEKMHAALKNRPPQIIIIDMTKHIPDEN